MASTYQDSFVHHTLQKLAVMWAIIRHDGNESHQLPLRLYLISIAYIASFFTSEFIQISRAVAMGFVALGALGYFVKMVDLWGLY
ncbi:hypothetical protein BC936DRAFT_138915 [Jimgerdemannia flammicorona]|uniref:Uncharacterized protein n=1 Tax=Jimgerdemannia flammicorona TaxID=994334 RepID=A0A433BDT9_9FUNG|nr:hypothetical protein BC936DRAFT_138915 [Jimgerdemannia flammicorona]